MSLILSLFRKCPAGPKALKSCDGMETLKDRLGCKDPVHNVFSLPEET